MFYVVSILPIHWFFTSTQKYRKDERRKRERGNRRKKIDWQRILIPDIVFEP